ncbi:MAG: hypothetical protein D3903_15145 [Candidatus Electrothrix sp. GM3_4]|nr:hypothetical protein [Candidatus Electrothrix sp. GM3_4]
MAGMACHAKNIIPNCKSSYAVLNNDDIPKSVLASGFQDYSDSSKNAVNSESIGSDSIDLLTARKD